VELMPALGLSPAFSALAALTRFTPPQPVRTFLRAAGYRLRPPHAQPHAPMVGHAQTEVFARGRAAPHQRAAVLVEQRGGTTPTIVLGGFVPDATEQVFLLRGALLRHGSVYYFHYPRGGFSLDLVCAQLDDLVAELGARHGQRPVIFGVSFGVGLALEWLRRRRAAGRVPDLAGLVFVSPVACVDDVLAPGEAKPSSLLGRALKPYLEAAVRTNPAIVEKSRVIFTRMFEAGAQNRAALRALMTADELRHLRDGVLATIQGIDAAGACERVGALQRMPSLLQWACPGQLPLCAAPVLVLYAEKETAVLAAESPTRTAFTSALPAFFPCGSLQIVTAAPGGSPVQHASLIFHYVQFLPPVMAFYRGLKTGKTRLAA